jgi:hypothetical protein
MLRNKCSFRNLGVMKAQPGDMKTHLQALETNSGAMSLTLESWRLILEAWWLTTLPLFAVVASIAPSVIRTVTRSHTQILICKIK